MAATTPCKILMLFLLVGSGEMGRYGLRHNQDVPQFIHAANGQTCVAERDAAAGAMGGRTNWPFIDPGSYWSIAFLVAAAPPDSPRSRRREPH
jgi:hypothetical protein